MRILVSLSVLAGSTLATDPCDQLCDLIPGVCPIDGRSRCVDGTCTDLFWFNGSTLCNSSDPGCLSEELGFVTCDHARRTVNSGNERGLVALRPREYVEEEVEGLDEFDFEDLDIRGDGPNVSEEEIVFAPKGVAAEGDQPRGRRGFENFDNTSQFSSILQVVLHSSAIRRAFMGDIISGEHHLRQHPVYAALVDLLNRMYEAGDDSLDLTELRFAILEQTGYQGVVAPMQALHILLTEIGRISRRCHQALVLSTSERKVCSVCGSVSESAWENEVSVALIRFIDETGRQSNSVQEMLVASFNREDDAMCYGDCDLPAQHRIEEGVIHTPELFSFAIDRNPMGSSERLNNRVDTPLEINLAGIVEGGEEIRYRLVGIVREIGSRFVVDYFDSDSNEWIHANDTRLHVIQGQPRNGGSDAVLVFYERIV
ncbi:hypothetical protein C9890_0439 [Perkinsus sp. BL_2016]|nr:hypothetical protein C9890_0439 [Perkinsus sp. BL_2016]